MPVFRVILTKRGEWRDTQEEWSNGYFFNGDKPEGRANAEAFFLALFNREKTLMSGQSLVSAYYYSDPNSTVTIGKDWRADSGRPTSNNAALDTTNSFAVNLELAGLVKWRCGYTSKGKPRYVMKYIHGMRANATDPDKTAWKGGTELTAYTAGLTDGTLPGGAKLCRPDGTLCEPGIPDPWIRSRTLKRRGKRPN